MLSHSRKFQRLRIKEGVTMTMQQLSLPDCGSAMLTLSEPLTLDVIGQLECALNNLFFKLRKELRAGQPDPADLEFESWSMQVALPGKLYD
jgi:hypothetical protein